MPHHPLLTSPTNSKHKALYRVDDTSVAAPRPSWFHIALFLILLGRPALSAAPFISNISAAQRPGTKLVDITYNLTAAGLSAVAVSLQVSSDGGTTWTVPVVTVSGAIGSSVAPGTGKTIVWDAGTDWPNNFSTQMRYQVRADDGGVTLAGFSYIPHGSFTMGRTSGDSDFDAPPVTVTVSGFYMQQMETTQAQWDEVRTWGSSNGYTDLAAGVGKASNHPVTTVNWWDVVKWSNARSEKEGLQAVYTVSGAVMRTGTTEPSVNWTANGYRLPTEAEWEKAARGGVSGKRFPWGTDTINHSNANYFANSAISYDTTGYTVDTFHPSYATGEWPFTSPVGSFNPNGYGLYDMAGNVWEWCWDEYEPSYYSTSNGTTDPRGPVAGWDRMYRGGNWGSGNAFYARCAFRLHASPEHSYILFGFRPARGPTIGQQWTVFTKLTTLTNYLEWLQTHFGSTARTGSAADDADPDADGLKNLLEYALNLPPNAASRVPASVQATGGNLEYTYTRGTAAFNGGTAYQVEWSDDLTTWSSAGVVETLVGDDGTLQQVKATLPAGSGGRRFVRLRVQ
jgi:formylglycine-generating enzyme required for sulfatase activity